MLGQPAGSLYDQLRVVRTRDELESELSREPSVQEIAKKVIHHSVLGRSCHHCMAILLSGVHSAHTITQTGMKGSVYYKYGLTLQLGDMNIMLFCVPEFAILP